MNVTHLIAFMAGGLVSFAAYALIRVGADAEMYERRLERLDENLDEFANGVVGLWNEDKCGEYPDFKRYHVGRIMQIFL